MSRPFRFKRFEIKQNKAAMKVGSDGVLLGAWSSIPKKYACNHHGNGATNTTRVLDIGTGTGLLALMIAQRGETFSMAIDAIEIDENSFSEARGNFMASPWPERIRALHCSVQDFTEKNAQTKLKYDLIISNPPYFNNSLLCPDISRTTARHTAQLSYNDLLSCTKKLLSPDGIFAVILPFDAASGFIDLAQAENLHLVRRTDILPTPSSQPKRSLMEFANEQNHTSVSSDTIIIENGGRHIYSSEYKQLTKDFYLKF